MASLWDRNTHRALYVWSTLRESGLDALLGADDQITLGDRRVLVTGVRGDSLRPQADIWIRNEVLEGAAPTDILAHVLDAPSGTYVRFIEAKQARALGTDKGSHTAVAPQQCVMVGKVRRLLRAA